MGSQASEDAKAIADIEAQEEVTMKQEQPTQAQLQELWEWCGFKIRGETEGEKLWYAPDGIVFNCGAPPLDLNNLFKYAIPKLKSEFPNWKSVLLDWLNCLTGDYEKDVPTLFWLIWGVIHGK